MLDLKLIEEKPDYVKAALAKKGWDFDPAPLLKLFQLRRDLLKEVEYAVTEVPLVLQQFQQPLFGFAPDQVVDQLFPLLTSSGDPPVGLNVNFT